MLPLSNLNDMLYPMQADINYATQTQGSLGNMINTWDLDRTLACSAIKQRATYNADYMARVHRDEENNVKVNFRSATALNISSSGARINLSDIMVTNITDALGNYIWAEPDGTAMKFEVESVEPLIDEFGIPTGYRALIMRSSNQDA
jgi:hypothetical protein